MGFAPVASKSFVLPGTMTGVEVDGQKVLLANVDGTVHALGRKCPHMGFDLCKGTLRGATVTCRMHGATFDLATGEALEKAKLFVFKTQPKSAKTYEVKVEGDTVSIRL